MPSQTRVMQTAVLSIIALGLITGFLWAFPIVEETHPSGDATDTFTGPDEQNYTSTGAIYADGQLFTSFTAEITANDSQYRTVEGPNQTVTEYAPSDQHGIVYARYIVTEADEEEHLMDRIGKDDDERIIATESSGNDGNDGVEIVTVRSEDPRYVDDAGGELRNSDEAATSLIVTNLFRQQYAAAGSPSSNSVNGDAVTYVPVDGWYENPAQHRITGSDGSVVVDSDTYELQYVDVVYTYTEADGWLDYYSNRADGETATIALEYEHDATEPEIETPRWVTDVQNEHPDEIDDVKQHTD